MKLFKFWILLAIVFTISACTPTKPENDHIMATNGYTGSNIDKNTNTSETQVFKEVSTPTQIGDMLEMRGEQDKATPELMVESPKEGETINSSNVKVKVKVGGDLKMGKDEKGNGNHVHVILDNQPYAAHYMWDEGFELRNVPDGEHTLRMFPSRPWHESYKNEKAFKTIKFTVKDGKADETKPTTDDKGNKMADAKKDSEGATVESSTAGNVNFSKPLLTYSRPKGDYKGADAEAIMVDFWLNNTKLTGDGGEYKVRLSIDDKEVKMIEKWGPIWLSGWTNGTHKVKLELVDKNGNLVENGGYNSTTREINVSK